MIVIHPNDISTEFLRALYKGREDVTLVTEEYDYFEVFDILDEAKKDEIIMMLGHGNWDGLLAPTESMQMGYEIIAEDHVEILREHTCIGIWCYANLFAKKHNLKGLFSGMVVSEPSEAERENVLVMPKDLTMENELYAQRLRTAIDHFPLEQVPSVMQKQITPQNACQEYNYNSLHYYE